MRCAVLGGPIAHSLSPVLHRAAYAELGLDWAYDAVEVDEAGLAGVPRPGWTTSWRGLSLTMPLKRRCCRCWPADEVDAGPRLAGAANTPGPEAGAGARRQHRRARRGRRGPRAGADGAGAARRSCSAAAPRRPRCCSRWPSWAATAVTAAGARPGAGRGGRRRGGRHPDGPAVAVAPARRDHRVDRRPAGLHRPGGGPDRRRWSPRCAAVPVVFEVVYDPWPTPLAAAAASEGACWSPAWTCWSHQAALQVRADDRAAPCRWSCMRARRRWPSALSAGAGRPAASGHPLTSPHGLARPRHLLAALVCLLACAVLGWFVPPDRARPRAGARAGAPSPRLGPCPSGPSRPERPDRAGPTEADPAADADVAARQPSPPARAREPYVASPRCRGSRARGVVSGLVGAALGLASARPGAAVPVSWCRSAWRWRWSTGAPAAADADRCAPTSPWSSLLVLLAAAVDRGRRRLLPRCSAGRSRGGIFWLLWLIYSRGLGFGDVRLAGVLGLALGYLGWSELLVGPLRGVPARRPRAVLALCRLRDRCDRKRVPVRAVHARRRGRSGVRRSARWWPRVSATDGLGRRARDLRERLAPCCAGSPRGSPTAPPSSRSSKVCPPTCG